MAAGSQIQFKYLSWLMYLLYKPIDSFCFTLAITINSKAEFEPMNPKVSRMKGLKVHLTKFLSPETGCVRHLTSLLPHSNPPTNQHQHTDHGML